ncbi:MAG TPA: HNH endonuclease signature motif containing protein [Acidimicrobiales bacterium]|nr:HNH endonuclease signature motif containing protein [Acidimicrobiales bacterium]
MVEGLALEVKSVHHLDVDGLGDDELHALVVDLDRIASSLDAARAQLAAALDARRSWADTGARSCAAFLAHQTRRPRPECGGRVALGRKLRALPLAAAAWAAGDIAEAHARRLAQACNHRSASAMERDEAVLVDLACTLPFHEFAQAIAYWELHADPDGADDDAIDRRHRRRVGFATTFGGMGHGSLLLDPVSAEIFGDELRRLEGELFVAERARTKERLGRDPRAGEYERTPDQRRADALIEMARRSATAPADGRPPRPLFQVVLGADSLARLLELAGGAVVAPTALVPHLEEADLERYLFAGTPDRVISVSRRRTFTGALRDLVKVRHRWCYHPTCDEPAARCEIDHIEPWGAGGLTTQDNGRPACGHHNRLRHRRPPPRPDG